MDKGVDIVQKRAMLSTIRMRFSPQLQPIKEAAIDKMIEQQLYVTDKKTGLTLQEIQGQGVIYYDRGHGILRASDIKDSIKRLVEKERVRIMGSRGEDLYKLSEEVLLELERMFRETESLFNSVVSKLFKNIPTPQNYSAPFIKSLSIIFSTIGEKYVRIIKGDIKKEQQYSFPEILSTVDQVSREHAIDKEVFKNAVINFFREDDPKYDSIKWNMVQNYYIAKVIGLEPDSNLLSQELFGNSDLYLDTNILISALDEEHKHHKGFRELSNACKKLNIRFKVCQLSIEELRASVNSKRRLLEKVVDQIPEETIPKVRGTFLNLYYNQLKLKGSVNFDEIFSSFNSPVEDLREKFNVELVDDEWFDRAKYEKETQELAEELAKKYEELRGHRKNEGSAMDDAILIRWLQRCKEEKGKVGLVTLDTSLPGSLCEEGNKAFIITLDALLQWISPIALQSEDQNDFARVFSEAVEYQLLPKDRFFELKDFIIFSELQMSCKELPAEDVEGCIQYIKSNAPKLDPSKSEDREKISYEVLKFFTSPGRKYKQEIERLELGQKATKEEYEKKLGDAFSNIKQLEEKNRKIEEENEKRISNLEQQIQQDRQKREQEVLKNVGLIRLSIIVLILVVYEITVVYYAVKLGEGGNWYQKILKSWVFITGGPLFALMFTWFFLGKERIRALGWPYMKLLKDE